MHSYEIDLEGRLSVLGPLKAPTIHWTTFSTTNAISWVGRSVSSSCQSKHSRRLLEVSWSKKLFRFFLIVVLCLVACNEQRLCQRTEMLLYPLIRLAIVTEEGRHPDLRSRPSNVVWTDGQVAEGCLRGPDLCSNVCRQLLFSGSVPFFFFGLFQILSGNQKTSHSCVGLVVPACWLCAQLQLLSSSQTLSFFCSRTLCAWHWCEDESSSLEAKSLPRSSFPVRQKRLSAVPIWKKKNWCLERRDRWIERKEDR